MSQIPEAKAKYKFPEYSCFHPTRYNSYIWGFFPTEQLFRSVCPSFLKD